jgi:threonine synthase
LKYYSLINKNTLVDFKDATIKGQAEDGGLFYPQQIPMLSPQFLANYKLYNKYDLALQVMQPYIGKSIDSTVLQQIIENTINFSFPLIQVTNHIFSLELFHGNTLAFKDVGAKFMSQCLGYFNKNNNKAITVLVATSGDTGGAVASGFLGVEGVNVIILYPSNKVSKVQELQLTTLGKNITAIELQGTFDDCQTIVKTAFKDPEIQQRYTLTSANSINIARWLPQQLYYFFAMQQWQKKEAPVVSVPSGNFGNICAGLLAYKSGLAIKKYIAACNANDTIPNYFLTQHYTPKPAIATLSNAMDVGNPSNFERILAMFDNNFEALNKAVFTQSIDDETTKNTIKKVYQQHQYTLDPHAAVAYTALENYLHSNPTDSGFFLATAHPIKFPEVVEANIGKALQYPEAIKSLLTKQKKSIVLPANYTAFKQWMLA